MMKHKTAKPSNFRINTKMRRIHGETVVERRFNNDTGEKTVLKCLFEWGKTTCGRGIGAGLRV
jgi:hypothetical protein